MRFSSQALEVAYFVGFYSLLRIELDVIYDNVVIFGE